MATSPEATVHLHESARLLPVERVQDLLRLQRAAQKMTSTLDLDELIQQLVTEVACSFGCVEINLYLHEPEQGAMVLAGSHGCTVHGRGMRLRVGKDGMVGYVAATGQMRYAPDVAKDPYYIACEQGTRSEVAIPLHVDGQLVGVFTASHPEMDGFSPEQLRLFQGLCSHLAVAVHNARRFEKERTEREKLTQEAHEARAIQQALLPKCSPLIPGFAVSGMSVPAGAVGGDWYDFIDLGDGRWGLVLADVAGKGTAAALLMSATRAMLRSLAQNACSPGEVLEKLNGLLVNDFPSGRFVTMVYGVLDPAARTFTFANAGHLPPLLTDASGARYVATEMGLPLGLQSGSFSEVTVDLGEGTRLALYSDGITEAENPQDEEYGRERLAGHVSRAGTTMDGLIEEVRRFANGAGLRDDATVILVEGRKVPST